MAEGEKKEELSAETNLEGLDTWADNFGVILLVNWFWLIKPGRATKRDWTNNQNFD
jgi:hypothetical protein